MTDKTENISVSITSGMLRALREGVESGEYASTSEAMRDAVRMWQRQRLENAERLAGIRDRIRGSVADPRPSLTEEQTDAHFQVLFATTA